MGFLESAAVQQKDVADKLASIDTGYRDPHLFWGRWADSKWGYWWLAMAVVPGAGGGSPAAAGNAKRIWHVKNLLVTFDDNGVMQKREVIDDDRILWRRLHEHVAMMPALDLSQPEFLSVDTPHSRPILLHREYFEVTAAKKAPCASLPVPSSKSRMRRAKTKGTTPVPPATPCASQRKLRWERTSATAATRKMS
jgi:hypothetical protein